MTQEPNRKLRLINALVLFSFLAGPEGAFARNQWEIQHQGAIQTGTTASPGIFGPGGSQVLHPDFWKGVHPSLSNRIQPGVVLTGALDDTISSAKNRSGDTFAITLQDGFFRNGYQIVPPGAKVVGVISSSTPSRALSHGHPGRLTVSLQSLVFPDGSHVPFCGVLDHNPNHLFKKPPRKTYPGSDLRDYPDRVQAMFSSFSSGLGTSLARRHRGLDFTLDKGEIVPIRLTKTLVVPPHLVREAAGPAPQGAPAIAPGFTDGVAGAAPPSPTTPSLVDQSDVFNEPPKPSPALPIDDLPDPF